MANCCNGTYSRFMQRRILGMDHLYSEVLGKLKNKGLAPFEITGLIKDIALFNRTIHNFNLTILNDELESLGWGIQVIDKSLYDDLTFLLEQEKIQNLVMYVGQLD